MKYPQASIPLSPTLSWHSLRASEDTANGAYANSILANKNVIHVTSGRAAIALALEQSNIAKADEVLIPAYHCESMVSPVHWVGANPVFYKINMDASIDFEDISRKLTEKTKAIVVTHYFGFIQDMGSVAELCQVKGIVIIEDCAHAFFGSRNGQHVGSWGDYAIASSMKFFPVYDGGVLSSRDRVIDQKTLKSPSIFFQIKSPLNAIQFAIRYGRLGFPGVLLKWFNQVAESVWGLIKKLTGRQQSGIHGPSSSGGGYSLDEDWIHCRSSWFSRVLIRYQSKERIARLRRKNYRRLEKSLRGLPYSHPLFDKLPEGTVPLVFPLYVDNPEHYFGPLKSSGVPIWRFGEFLDDQLLKHCAATVWICLPVFFNSHATKNSEILKLTG